MGKVNEKCLKTGISCVMISIVSRYEIYMTGSIRFGL